MEKTREYWRVEIYVAFKSGGGERLYAYSRYDLGPTSIAHSMEWFDVDRLDNRVIVDYHEWKTIEVFSDTYKKIYTNREIE